MLYVYSLVRVSAKNHCKETEAQIGEVSYPALPSENFGAKLEINPDFSGFPASAVLVQLLPPRGTCSRDLEGVDRVPEFPLGDTSQKIGFMQTVIGFP